MSAGNEITALLKRAGDGQLAAMDDLLAAVYQEMRALARTHLRKESREHSLDVTDLVHETYLRLFDGNDLCWQDRRHFFGSAARAMRRILVEHARKKQAAKRIPDTAIISWEDHQETIGAGTSDEIVALDRALNRLAELDARQAEVVELRYFGGLSETEVAQLLEMSRSTVGREWRAARLWLLRELQAR